MIAVLAGLVVAAAGAIWGLVERARLTEAKNEAERLRQENETLREKLGTVEATAADRAKRLETVIAEYKREVAELEAEVAKCQDPSAVRERLRRLLGGGDA